MADGIGVQLEGFYEIDRMLEQLPEKARNRVIGPALRAAMKPAAMSARRRAWQFKDTGTLSKSIVWRLLKRRRGRHYVVATMGPSKDAAAPPYKYPYNYASYYGMVVEFGWSDTGISPSKHTAKKGWKMRAKGSASRPPRPFLRPALAERAPHILNDMKKHIGKKIEKEAAKLAKKR